MTDALPRVREEPEEFGPLASLDAPGPQGPPYGRPDDGEPIVGRDGRGGCAPWRVAISRGGNTPRRGAVPRDVEMVATADDAVVVIVGTSRHDRLRRSVTDALPGITGGKDARPHAGREVPAAVTDVKTALTGRHHGECPTQGPPEFEDGCAWQRLSRTKTLSVMIVFLFDAIAPRLYGLGCNFGRYVGSLGDVKTPRDGIGRN